MNFKQLSLLCAGLFCGTLLAGSYPLTGSSVKSHIMTNPVPTAEEHLAERELQDAIRKISGQHVHRLPDAVVFSYRTGEQPVKIVLVTADNGKNFLPADVVKKLSATDNPEAFYLKTATLPGNNRFIYIAGKSPRGVLCGTYYFIEKYLGVRWFHAGDDGSYYPKKREITLPEINEFREPWLRSRKFSHWEKSIKPFKMDEFRTWLNRRTYHWGTNIHVGNFTRDALDFSICGGNPLSFGGHLTFECGVPKTLFKTHPEYFPLQGGKRVCKERSQRCLSNPEVQKLVINHICDVVSYYHAGYGVTYHDSTDGWCECAGCRKMGTGADGQYSVTNLAHAFSSLVCNEVLKKYPDANLTYSIYSQFRVYPSLKTLNYDKRVTGDYCPHQRCYVHPFEGSECNRELYDLMLKWQKVSPIGVFDYYAYSHTPYCPLEYTLAKDMKMYKKFGLKFFIDDCTNKDLPYPRSNWQFYYLMGQLMWDSDIDVDKVLDEAYTLYYGKASAPMKKYHELRRQLWESVPGHAAYGGGKRYGQCLLDPAREKRILGYLAEAEKLAGNDPVLKKRISFDRMYLTEYWITEAHKLRKQTGGASSALPVALKKGAIKIDGKLDEDAWRSAQFLPGFRESTTKGDPVEETRVRILYDDSNWYIGIEAMTEHAWSPLKATRTKRDSDVWVDDAIEIFVVPPKKDYFHWIINSIGTMYDARVRATSFDSRAEVKTSVQKDRYIVEIRIPVEPMGVKKISGSDVWKMHFARECQNLQPPKSHEHSTINAVPPHEETLFSKVAMGTPVTRNGDFKQVGKTTANDLKHMKGAFVPSYWSIYGGEMITKNGKNMILQQDLVSTWLCLPKRQQPTKVSGTVTVSGKGTYKISLSGCVRKPGDKRPFGHEQKPVVREITLTPEPTAYSLEFTVEPYSEYYMDLRVRGGTAVLENCFLSY